MIEKGDGAAFLPADAGDDVLDLLPAAGGLHEHLERRGGDDFLPEGPEAPDAPSAKELAFRPVPLVPHPVFRPVDLKLAFCEIKEDVVLLLPMIRMDI